MGSFLKAGHASASVFEISLSLTNTLKSLQFASMLSASFPYGGGFKHVPCLRFPNSAIARQSQECFIFRFQISQIADSQGCAARRSTQAQQSI
ncbi:MAG: hypothetical protein EZS28_010406 [Streblomastix strix]|uniref:Uncharacterized protein n=1 Tax=Streblomastix strix TaxID=222440 RepID=A0A5J4WH95_9EUKA|nr:MAG: hypothetical protein EZS28_010406 [Streblomastix strix]